MKQVLFLVILSFFQVGLVFTQDLSIDRNPLFSATLKPFYHGVASGEPTESGFVIWTRLSPDQSAQTSLTYFLSKTPDFQTTIKTGQVDAISSRDFTARVALTDLEADQYYYYYFAHPEGNSLIGRAKTLPIGSQTHLRFAVVSCSNYESGYFNAYGAIAKRNDLDAVLHLGDYIYEYPKGTFAFGRAVLPEHEILNLADYRTRYNTYRLDPDLIRLHQQHTMISIWDDHESANGSSVAGAYNHQANEGDWAVRKAISKQVYHEWMPLNTPDTASVYQAYRFGNLADVLMLDTRLEGRERQPAHFDTPDIPLRHMISDTQMLWLTSGLKSADTRWKIIGNQVIFSDINIGLLAGAFDGQPDPTNIDSIRVAEDTQLDNWEAYPTQRAMILDTIAKYQLPGVVIASGDSHASWVFDVAKQPVLYPLQQFNYLPQPNPYQPGIGGYDPNTRAGTLAVEFCVPSVSSPNFDEAIGFIQTAILEQVLNQPATPPNPVYNPHLKFTDLDRHGYYILNIKPDTVQADYYHMASITSQNLAETFTLSAFTIFGQPAARIGFTPSANKPAQATPTPTLPFGTVSTLAAQSQTVITGAFPNPTTSTVFLHLISNQSETLNLTIFDPKGREYGRKSPIKLGTGVHFEEVDLTDLPNGVYFIRLSSERTQADIRIVKQD
jgi:alkaline phosphatase D